MEPRRNRTALFDFIESIEDMRCSLITNNEVEKYKKFLESELEKIKEMDTKNR